MNGRVWIAAVGGMLIGCTLASCRMPWTIRPIAAGEEKGGAGRPFDPTAYVDSIWDTKVVRAAANAPDFAQAKSIGRATLVKGTGRVLRIDTARGEALLDIAPYDGKPDAALATGPIRGTALRDALPFIQFSQFLNQVDFAHAANALDDRATSAAAGSVKGLTAGAVLSFAGALDPAGDPPEIVPVTLTREPSRP